jgi:tetratricopeptide (TPR) repeat protein
MGNTADAVREIKSAEEMCTADTDSLTHLQILLNRGVSHVSMKNYKLADDYFYKAAEYYKNHRMQDKELLAVLYYNYVFNKARLGGDEWKDVLEEYKSYLNLKKVNDCISYFNIRIELLRQTNTDRTIIEKAVQESFALIMNCEFPKENKCIFVSSVARVVWSARINPAVCLDTMTCNLETLRNLPMPARYNAFKNIDLLFMDLHGNIAELHIS